MHSKTEKRVWIAWTNTDCTEGRGVEYPLAICETTATAIRLGRKGGVQGSNCRVTEAVSHRIDNQWMAPYRLMTATKEDISAEKIQQHKDSVVAKALAAGLTKSEIESLANK